MYEVHMAFCILRSFYSSFCIVTSLLLFSASRYILKKQKPNKPQPLVWLEAHIFICYPYWDIVFLSICYPYCNIVFLYLYYCSNHVPFYRPPSRGIYLSSEKGWTSFDRSLGFTGLWCFHILCEYLCPVQAACVNVWVKYYYFYSEPNLFLLC